MSENNKHKNILLIGYNYTPEPTGIGKYSGEMIEWLARKGHHCTVITTYPYYPYWKIQEPYVKNRFWYKHEIEIYSSGGKIDVYRCPMYVPKNPSGLKRIILDASFFGSALLQMTKFIFFKKFDYAITVVPSFQLGLLGVFFKKIRKVKLIYHIQDLQIEAAQDLNMIKSKQLIKNLFKLENYIFKKADVISSISQSMVRLIEKKSNKPVCLFPNWADTGFFYPIYDQINLKEEFGFKSTDKIILYSGAIGEKQGLDIILDIAREYIEKPSIKFIICGTGPYKKKLQEISDAKHLSNVFFFPLQPSEKFNRFLNMADIHLVIQKSKASDLVMPSKLTTILAVGGLAVITANKDSGLYDLISRYDMGILVAAENNEALSSGIRNALKNHDNSMGNTRKNARDYAEKYLSIDGVMLSFEKELLKN